MLYLLAPRADLLSVDAEIQAVMQSSLPCFPRLGHVTHSDVVSDIAAGDYEGLWFAGHASAQGLLLSDGVLLNEELIPLTRGMALVFLNTCESETTARLLHREIGATIIATVMTIPDRLAYQTGALFAQELVAHGDIEQAFRRSDPGRERTYIYLAGVKKKCL